MGEIEMHDQSDQLPLKSDTMAFEIAISIICLSYALFWFIFFFRK